MKQILISPSVLACDFANLELEVLRTAVSGADMLHLDVMDGHFVPNITFGSPVIASLREKTDLLFDVHLMISNPSQYLEAFVKAGADIITFHYEAMDSEEAIHTLIREIHAMGKKASVSLKPRTPADVLLPFLAALDMVLIMTVEPGFGGQSFMPDMIEKIAFLRKQSASLAIQVDGGITSETAKLVIEAGATVLVAGTAVYGTNNYKEAMDALRG